MGAWGVAIFSDDLAADIRDSFRDLIGDGVAVTDAVDRLLAEYAPGNGDGDMMAIFWVALAATQCRLGRLEERTKVEALRVIDSGADLLRWDLPKYRARRRSILDALRIQLLLPPATPKHVPRRIRSATDWVLGEVIAFQLARSGDWTLMRVVGYHGDKGGRSAVCEMLDWTGKEIPTAEIIDRLSVRYGKNRLNRSQFLFQEPRKKKDQERVRRLGHTSTPVQNCAGYTAFVWPFVDRLMKSCYGME